MPLFQLFLLALAAIVAPAPARSQATAAAGPAAATVAAVESRVTDLIAGSGAEVAVFWRPLAAGEPPRQFLINGTTRFHAASTMKVPIMIELFRQAALGRIALDDTLLVTNRFSSIVDGSPYELQVSDDSDGRLYEAVGQRRSYRDLCEAMITTSSNLAANLLLERLGAQAIQQTVVALDAAGMQVLRGVEDQKAFDRGLNNTTDAVGLGTLLWKLGRGEVVSAPASEAMIAILSRQAFSEGIPAGVPPGTRVAHKTGSITRINHDAAIVFAPQPYVLVVLVRGIEDSKQSDALIAGISRLVWPLGGGASAP